MGGPLPYHVSVIMIILNRGLKEVNELIHSNQKSPSLFLEESNS